VEPVQYKIISLSLWDNSAYFLFKSILLAFATSFNKEKNISPQNQKATIAHSNNVKLKFATLSSKNTFFTQSQ
jgi:hypothetical protein